MKKISKKKLPLKVKTSFLEDIFKIKNIWKHIFFGHTFFNAHVWKKTF